MSEGKATSHAKMSQCLAPRESPTNISPLLLLLMPPSGGGRERRVWWTRAETSCITTQSKESMSDKDGSRMAGTWRQIPPRVQNGCPREEGHGGARSGAGGF